MREVWYVSGDPNAVGLWPSLFDTKEAAEAYARLVFPDDGEDRRYARVYFRTVLTLADLNGG
jgi:hypothetical protein